MNGPHWVGPTGFPIKKIVKIRPENLKDLILSYHEFTDSNGCWFLSEERQFGYQTVKWNGKNIALHILSAIAFHNHKQNIDFKNRILICHKCDRKACFNPDHIYIGNDKTNRKDSLSRLRNFHGISIEFAAKKFLDLNHLITSDMLEGII